MNKEYVLLPDSKVAIANENGNIQIRNLQNKELLEKNSYV